MPFVCVGLLLVLAVFLCIRFLAHPISASAVSYTAAPVAAPASVSMSAPAESSSLLQSATDNAPPPSSPSPSPSIAPSATPGATASDASSPTQTQPAVGQLIVVLATGGSDARVSLYELENGKWVRRLQADGCVGRAGVVDAGEKKEGDKKTPKGFYSLGFAFGTEKPETRMDFRLITESSCWVDDPDSEYYNTWQEGENGWKSAEKLANSARSYHYAVVVNYNTGKVVPFKGSAIFLHCKTKAYTSGCIAVPEKTMLEILKMLDPLKNPSILIEDSVKAINGFGFGALE